MIGTAAAMPVKAQLGIDKDYVEPPGFSVGMNLGISDLWGDVGTQNVINHYANDEYFNNLHAMGGLFVRYCAAPAFAMRLGVNHGSLYANDNWNYTAAKSAKSIEDDSYQRYMRNQNVRSRTWEGYFLFEFSPLRLNPSALVARRRFQPYIMAGVGYFHFKPQTEYVTRAGNSKGWIDLYDLNLEGNGITKDKYPGLSEEVYKNSPATYSLWQLCIPLGLGVKWDIGRHLALGIEYNYRYCFTDYLDGVSGKYIDPALFDIIHAGDPAKAGLARELYDRSWQRTIDQQPLNIPGNNRGNPSVNDAYSTFGVMLMFKIPGRKDPWWY